MHSPKHNVESDGPIKSCIIGTGFAHAKGRFHLFYDTLDAAVPSYTVAYAYSDDGFHWVKPDLGRNRLTGSEVKNLLNIPRGQTGSWNEVRVCSAGALYELAKWRLWVAGYHRDNSGALHSQLTLFEGSEPDRQELVVDEPVVPNGASETFDWGFTRVPCVIREDDTFRMYYTAGDGNNGWFAGYAESPDGRNWTKPDLGLLEYGGSTDNNLVLAGESARGETRVAHPWVFKDGDIYRIYYSVSLADYSYAIGTGTSDDGIHWTKNQRTAVLPRGPEGSFDYWYAAIPRVVREGDAYRMWYTGYDGGEGAGAPGAYALGYAESSDGVHWRKHKHNPVFDS